MDCKPRPKNGYQTGTKTSKSDLAQPDAISRIIAKQELPNTPEATHNLKVAGSNPAPATQSLAVPLAKPVCGLRSGSSGRLRN